MASIQLVKTFITTLGGLFFPPYCPICTQPLTQPHQVCNPCAAKLPWINFSESCNICSHPLPKKHFPSLPTPLSSETHSFCPHCRSLSFAFDCAVSLLRATGSVRDLIHEFKYEHHTAWCGLLGNWLIAGLSVERLKSPPIDLLVPVPLHPARQRERRFNQAQLLAQWIAKSTQYPLASLLIRTRYTSAQAQLDRSQRLSNLRHAFTLHRRWKTKIRGLHILLIDDVLTTGSTLHACAQVLKEAGAKSVRALTIARG